MLQHPTRRKGLPARAMNKRSCAHNSQMRSNHANLQIAKSGNHGKTVIMMFASNQKRVVAVKGLDENLSLHCAPTVCITVCMETAYLIGSSALALGSSSGSCRKNKDVNYSPLGKTKLKTPVNLLSLESQRSHIEKKRRPSSNPDQATKGTYLKLRVFCSHSWQPKRIGSF